MFHGGLWGGWQYSVASQQPNASTLRFGFGGHQEARGSSVTKNHFFIDSIFVFVLRTNFQNLVFV